MYMPNRASLEYISALDGFISVARADMLRNEKTQIRCPCRGCKNEVLLDSTNELQAHLIMRGFVDGYRRWTCHGEELEGHEADEVSSELSDEDDQDIADGHDNLQQMLCDAEGTNPDGREYPQFLSLLEDSEKPLFPGCKAKHTRLAVALEMLKLKASSNWSDVSFTKLLRLIADILPEGNGLPTSTYKAKKVICPLGLEVEKIHGCPNDCILYRKEYADLHRCPVCKASRYKRGNNEDDGIDDHDGAPKGPPAKVAWYLPVIPRLKRLFANKQEAKQLCWHSEGRKVDGIMRHPIDATQWRNVDRVFEDFGQEPRNIRFGMSTDGFNPFGNMSSRHNTWPVCTTFLLGCI
jgi:hypothetical protein